MYDNRLMQLVPWQESAERGRRIAEMCRTCPAMSVSSVRVAVAVDEVRVLRERRIFRILRRARQTTGRWTVSLDRETLERSNCWFGVDQVPRDEGMTAFKREARYRQACWRESKNLAVGSHANSSRGIENGGPERILNGSRLDEVAAAKGLNFLSPAIRSAVDARLAARQDRETLDVARLRGDLLSSMPMCFNLFGELTSDQERATRAAQLMMPTAKQGSVEVIFEWSPGRGSHEFTRDGTAFDVALLVGDPGGARQVIGIETKYHEHSIRESVPKPEQRERHESQTAHYIGIAERSGRFRQGWKNEVLDTDLRQIWRDHLLLLSMIEQQSVWSEGCYVLVYPERNISFGQAAERYQSVLIAGDQTFRAMTLESLLAEDVLHAPETGQAFRERYLW